MSYEVFLSEPAEAEAQAAFLWLARFAPDFAGEWYSGFLKAIASLSVFPGRCPLAPEMTTFRDAKCVSISTVKAGQFIVFYLTSCPKIQCVFCTFAMPHSSQSAKKMKRPNPSKYAKSSLCVWNAA